MPSVNKFIGVGHLGKDAELRYTASGTPLVTFSIAMSENRKVGDEWKENTTWLNVSWFGDMAERISQSLTKGGLVYVEGRINTRTWDKNDGTKGYATEVMAEKVLSLEKREGATNRSRGRDTDIDDLPYE